MRPQPSIPKDLPAKHSSLDIALVSEGTYPYFTGGVSVWCHQLIQGISDSNFQVVAITVNGLERSIWGAPPNLSKLINLPLWGIEPPPAKPRLEPPPAWFEQAHATFLRTLIRSRPDHDQQPAGIHDTFLECLQNLFHYAQEADLSAAMMSNGSIERLLDLWASERPEPLTNTLVKDTPNLSLADALAVSSLLEHLLRPLSHPPLKVDLVHAAMNGLSTLIGMTSKWKYGTPLIMSEHGIYLRERYLSYLNDPVSYPVKIMMLNFFRLLTSSAYQVADIIAPHSRYNRRWELHNGAKAAQLRTMYNGVDPKEFYPQEEESKDPAMVFMGRIDPLKDLHTLIRTFAIVKQSEPEARLRIFGPVPAGNEAYYKSCLDLIAQLGLKNAASFEGRVNHPREAYHAGQVVVLSSISEGFPYTVIEAMASGLPTVSTNVGGVSEGVGRAGIVVPPRDPGSMAAACLRLLADPKLRKRLGVAARERVLQKFTLEQSIQDYCDAYQEAISGVEYPEEAAAQSEPLPIRMDLSGKLPIREAE